MVYQTDGNLTRARNLIAAGDEASLQYAALELRLALEKIAYSKLHMRLKGVPHERLRKWQPQRVIETLMELVDPAIDRDHSIRMARENEHGNPTKWFHLGDTKGVGPREIGKNWQKLGSLLHIRMPKTKDDVVPLFSVTTESAEFLTEVANYIAALTSSNVDGHFSMNLTFTCEKCNEPIAINEKTAREGRAVTCPNSACGFMYVVTKQGAEFVLLPYRASFECASCKRTVNVDWHRLSKLGHEEGVEVTCECGDKYVVEWSLTVGKPPN